MKRAALLCVLLAGAVPSLQAQVPQLGRLFSTPEQRSSGRSTVWLNQAPQNEPYNSLARGQDGILTLRLSTGQVVLLKPGQRYDPASGTVTEAPEKQP
ncbi:hypothetical protein GQ37_000700 [Janthinobacterium sp. BJB1]|nr:hypothetical protein GQ37_000700 [Janthinobacterium sp. BJB1]